VSECGVRKWGRGGLTLTLPRLQFSSQEIKSQMLEVTGRLPDAVVACVGGGSNAIGSFHTFIPDSEVELYGAEAAGYGLSVDEGHCATLTVGTKGVLQGAMTYIIQSPSGQSCLSHSISAGLDYVGVGPEHAHLKATKRASYMAVDDKQAMEGEPKRGGNCEF